MHVSCVVVLTKPTNLLILSPPTTTTVQIVLLKGWHLDDEDMTRAAIARSNIVINLVGATEETRNFSFADVHEAWPARLAAAVADAPRVERLLHFSDMGADADHPSARMRSKAAGDAALRAAVPGATIFK